MQTQGFHYTRESGELGQVLAREGGAPGQGLDVLLERQRPPLRAALELGSALADILCIAEEDRSVHGDLRPANIKVEPNGNVSVEGWGVPRRSTREPHGRTDLGTTDMYGLGCVLHSLLSEAPFGELPREPDGHDDAVVDRVVGMDFQAARGKRWVEDVRKFLCNILAWAPEERPLPLDAANVLASVAAQVQGESLADWAHEAGRRAAPAAAPLPTIQQEILGGPTSIAAPMARGGVRQAPSSKGESTSFWSREKIAQMLAEEDDEPLPPPRTSAPPLSQATPVSVHESWSAPQPRAVPPPPVLPTTPTPAPAAPPPEPTHLRTSTPPREPDPPRPVRQVSEPARAPERPPTPRPEARPATPRPAPAAEVIRAGADDPFAEPAPSSGPGLVSLASGAAVLALLCGGVLAVGAGGWFFAGRSETVGLDPLPPSDTPAPATDGGGTAAGGGGSSGTSPSTPPAGEASSSSPPAGAGAAPPAEPPASSPAKATTPSSTPAPKSTSTTSAATGSTTAKATTPKATTPKAEPAPKTTKAPKSAPVEAAPAGPFTVKFSVAGKEGKIQCGDGQSAEFVGGTSMSFDSVTTCRVKTSGKDGKQGVVQVEKAGSVTCAEFGTSLSCN